MKNTYEVHGDVATIFLKRKGGTTLATKIDLEDLELARSVDSWHVHWSSTSKSFYVQGHRRCGDHWADVILHRLLTNAPKGMHVDHINHDTLDNRKSNLRVVTRSQNLQNRAGATRTSKSGVRGVTWHKASNRWAAKIRVNGVDRHIGLFRSLADAAVAVEQARKEAGFLTSAVARRA